MGNLIQESIRWQMFHVGSVKHVSLSLLSKGGEGCLDD